MAPFGTHTWGHESFRLVVIYDTQIMAQTLAQTLAQALANFGAAFGGSSANFGAAFGGSSLGGGGCITTCLLGLYLIEFAFVN